MGLKISEKNKPRLTLIVILLVFASITMYSLNAESKQEITVEEGNGEINLSYIKHESTEDFYNETTDTWYKNTTAISTLGNKKDNSIQFWVAAEDVISSSDMHEIGLRLKVKGDFDKRYNLEELLIKIKEIEGIDVSSNLHDFDNSYVKEDNLELWPVEKNKGGSSGTDQAYIGFDLSKNKFSAEAHVTWRIPKSNWNNSYTLRLKSIVVGMEQDIPASVDVHIEKGVIE